MKKNRILSCLLALVLMATSVIPSFAATAGSGHSSWVLADGDYALLLHDDTNKCLNVLFATKKVDQRGVIGVDYFNNEKNEVFRITNRGSGLVTISPLHATNLCLNVNLGQGGKELALHGYTAGDKCSLWLPMVNEDGSITFRNAYATDFVLDLKNGDYTVGNKAMTWYQNGFLTAQGYFVKQVNGPTSGVVLQDGEYAFLLHDSANKCLNIKWATTTQDRTGVVIVDYFNSQSNEIFRVINRGNGYVTISPKYAPDLCINSLGAKAVPGEGLALHRWSNGDAASLWLPIRNIDGSWTFRNKATGYIIDLRCGDYSLGNYALSWVDTQFMRAQAFNLKMVKGIITVNSDSWKEPMKNYYVCGNEWSEYYAPKAAKGRPDHAGIDIASGTGSTDVVAAADGTVMDYGYNGDNGHYVLLKHTLSGKTVYSFYAHLKSYTSLTRGAAIKQGAYLGKMGTTGASSTGDHLHFAIMDSLQYGGGYLGYVKSFSGNKVTHGNVTFYNPHYVLQHNALPS